MKLSAYIPTVCATAIIVTTVVLLAKAGELPGAGVIAILGVILLIFVSAISLSQVPWKK